MSEVEKEKVLQKEVKPIICSGKTAAGTPCKNKVVKDGKFCAVHNK